MISQVMQDLKQVFADINDLKAQRNVPEEIDWYGYDKYSDDYFQGTQQGI